MALPAAPRGQVHDERLVRSRDREPAADGQQRQLPAQQEVGAPIEPHVPQVESRDRHGR